MTRPWAEPPKANHNHCPCHASAWIEYFRDGAPTVVQKVAHNLDHELIGTFCAENGYGLIHHDRDFDLMANLIGLQVVF